MWLALHHLLTGGFHLVASPLSRAILGGTAFREDVGYGPARFIWTEEVQEIATALASVTHEDLGRRYDPAGLKAGGFMTPIHYDEDDDEIFSELVSHFELLVLYYRIAASRGNAMMIGVV